ncbi:MAG: cytochrome c peroxidase, partial [Pseudomonadota bacterium]|nr:cytochrome c peroxidase [Pseudomonadota bacterium]
EQPVNETHFIKDRLASEVLGKALFWDMQVGSDGVQACGSCHAFAGVDHRTRNQLNPNANGGDLDLDLRGGVASTPQDTNAIDIVAADFPFHKRTNPDVVGDGFDPAILVSDSNDVLSSMGVSEFKQFDDVLVGGTAFGPASMGVAPLLPDLGTVHPDPIPVMQGNRRIEPRHTPTMHAAAFNFDNFWDGRARHDFNGGSVFGPSDPFFHIHVSCSGALRELAAPIEAEFDDPLAGLCEWTAAGGNYLGNDPADPGEPVPVRIRFSSLASQSVGPPLSDFEMAFGFLDPDIQGGRNWQKIGKKLLQAGVTPLAKQLVDPTDSRLGPWSNNMGSNCIALGVAAAGKPGLCTSYPELIEMAFRDELWNNTSQHLAGTAVPQNNACAPGEQIHETGIAATCDPFDGYVIAINTTAAADSANTNQFTQMEANFSLFFGLSVQTYEQLLIPDDTPWDKFNDLYPMLGNGVAQPGEQATLPPGEIRELVTGSPTGFLDVSLVDGIDEDVLFGFDIFAGGNLTAALPVGPRNPAAGPSFPLGVGSNPFLRTARCMLCHLGPEQSDHTNNVNAGLLQGGTEQEFPFPQGAPEPTGVLRLVTGFSLAEELEENAQDGVEVENRNFNIFGSDLSL